MSSHKSPLLPVSRALLRRGVQLGLLGLTSLLASACTRPPPLAPDPALAISTFQMDAPASLQEICDGSWRRWSVLNDHTEIASTQGICRAEQDGRWQVLSQLFLHAHSRPQYELQMVLDVQGRPLFGQLRTETVHTDFHWDQGTLRLSKLGEQRSLAAPGDAPIWVTPIHALYLRELMIRLGIGSDSAGLFEQQVYIPEHDSLRSNSLTIRHTPESVSAQFEGGTLQFEDTNNRIGGLSIEQGFSHGELIYKRLPPNDADAPVADHTLLAMLPEQLRPSYILPSGLQREAIEIQGDGQHPTLAGEWLVHNSPLPKGSRPGVIFLSGSGPQDRLGFVPGTSIDVGSHEIHDDLAQAGFLVLRMDDRGVGGSELGSDVTPGYHDYVHDGHRALLKLAQDPRVDPTKIIVIGHGEGALSALKIAQQKFKVGHRHYSLAGVIVLALPGRNLREVIYTELRSMLVGAPAAELELAIQDAKRVHAAALSGAELSAANEPLRDWMSEIFKEDPIALLRALKMPVLALQGGKDFQIDPVLDFGPVSSTIQAQRKPGRREKSAIFLEDLDHLFKPELHRSIPGHYADLSRKVSPKLLLALREWALLTVQFEDPC